MWTYPAYPYLEFALISLGLAILASVASAIIGIALAPRREDA